MYTRFLPAAALMLAGALALAQTPAEFKGHSAEVNCVALDQEGKLLATGSSDNTVKIFEFASGKVLHTLEGHKKPVYSVAFSKDGKYLASGSQDNTIRLWNPKDGKFIRELKG